MNRADTDLNHEQRISKLETSMDFFRQELGEFVAGMREVRKTINGLKWLGALALLIGLLNQVGNMTPATVELFHSVVKLFL